GLKERLIGAVVLAALAVWLIPWLLDGPDEPIGDDRAALELPVPSGHVGDIRTEVIDLSPRREAGGGSAAAGPRTAEPATARSGDGGGEAAAAGAARAATAAAAASSGGEGRAATSSAPATQTPSADGAERTAASRAAETQESGSAERAASSVPIQASTGAAPATARSGSTRQAPAASAEESGDWAVQVGSFGEEENARRHADRISTFGYSPKISTFTAGGRVMYRVRVGPHATRQEAEAAASALA